MNVQKIWKCHLNVYNFNGPLCIFNPALIDWIATFFIIFIKCPFGNSTDTTTFSCMSLAYLSYHGFDRIICNFLLITLWRHIKRNTWGKRKWCNNNVIKHTIFDLMISSKFSFGTVVNFRPNLLTLLIIVTYTFYCYVSNISVLIRK